MSIAEPPLRQARQVDLPVFGKCLLNDQCHSLSDLFDEIIISQCRPSYWALAFPIEDDLRVAVPRHPLHMPSHRH